MTSVHQQCQDTLERERAEIVTCLTPVAATDDTRNFNPVEDECVRLLEIQLRSIDAALQRLAVGQFGLCLACNHPISVERLLALPCAEYCIDCQRRREQQFPWTISRQRRKAA